MAHAGLSNVLFAALGSLLIFIFWVFVFPMVTMLVAVYICRFIPQRGWRTQNHDLSASVKERDEPEKR
jgi:uncharacterized BrkB/YihY/UPF0761 family membrane protein